VLQADFIVAVQQNSIREHQQAVAFRRRGQAPQWAAQLLPLQKGRQLAAGSKLIRKLFGKVVTEEQRREVPDRVANRRQISDHMSAKPGPDPLDSQRITRAFHGRARVQFTQYGHRQHHSARHFFNGRNKNTRTTPKAAILSR